LGLVTPIRIVGFWPNFYIAGKEVAGCSFFHDNNKEYWFVLECETRGHRKRHC